MDPSEIVYDDTARSQPNRAQSPPVDKIKETGFTKSQVNYRLALNPGEFSVTDVGETNVVHIATSIARNPWGKRKRLSRLASRAQIVSAEAICSNNL